MTSNFFTGKDNVSFLVLRSENLTEAKNLVILKDIIFGLPPESKLKILMIHKDGIDQKYPIKCLVITWTD